MDFAIFPFVMITLCVVMMVLMMGGMRRAHGGHRTVLSSEKLGCCGLRPGPWNERAEPSHSWWRQQQTSGNQTFDEYRAETLRRLEQEQRDFQDFLARLRLDFVAARRGPQATQPSA
jgi:hypothetical protein